MAREAITRAIDDAGIESAAVAMTQNPGGMGATAITHALEAT